MKQIIRGPIGKAELSICNCSRCQETKLDNKWTIVTVTGKEVDLSCARSDEVDSDIIIKKDEGLYLILLTVKGNLSAIVFKVTAPLVDPSTQLNKLLHLMAENVVAGSLPISAGSMIDDAYCARKWIEFISEQEDNDDLS